MTGLPSWLDKQYLFGEEKEDHHQARPPSTQEPGRSQFETGGVGSRQAVRDRLAARRGCKTEEAVRDWREGVGAMNACVSVSSEEGFANWSTRIPSIIHPS